MRMNKKTRRIVEPLKTAAAAVAATATTAIATADGSDAATTQALANATKAKANTLITEVTDVRAKLAAVTTAIDAL